MKKINIVRRIQIIILTLLVAIIGGIIVWTTTNDNAMAAMSKPCGDSGCVGTMTAHYIGSGRHRWDCNVCSYISEAGCSDGGYGYCGVCGYKIGSSGGGSGGCSHPDVYVGYVCKNEEQCEARFYCTECDADRGFDCNWYHGSAEGWSYSSNGNTKHDVICNACEYTKTENHEGATHANGGKCTVCNARYQSHGQSGTVKKYNQTTTGHTPVYGCTYSGCSSTYNGSQASHTGATHENGGKCIICEYQYQNHNQSSTIKEYKKTTSGHIPVYTCTGAGCALTYDGTEENHTGATHENGGTCTICSQQYETHGQSAIVKEYKPVSTGHKPVYKCTCEGCSVTYDGTIQDHSGSTHDNEGKCTLCGTQYEIHRQSTVIKEFKNTGIGHIPVYKCTCTGCSATYDGVEENHKGATHGNGGKCTVCGIQYEYHGQSNNITEYKKNATGHTPVYTCTQLGCTSTYDGITENHKGATHENAGRCTVCEYQYETHGQSAIVKEYKQTVTGHIPVYKCTCEKCSVTFDGIEEGHTGAMHANGGKCTTCDVQYQNHSQSETIKEYKTTETGHTPVYKCTQDGCTTTYDGTEESHTGATHENEGKCTICDEQYETHGKSGIVKEYKETATGHTPVYKCTQDGCTTTYDGTEESHTGATHENEGKCTICEYQYETHGQSETIKEYKTTGTGHTPVYKCTSEGCSTTYDGEEEVHTGATHENEGKCTICEYQYEIHGQSDVVKEYKATENGHTPVYKCTQDGCTTTYDGTEESHTGATHENEGKCTICEYQYEIHGQSDVVKEYKATENGHTPVYKCTQDGCTTTYDGTEESHTGATHENEGKCTICEYQYEMHGQSENANRYVATENGHKPVYTCTQSGCSATYEGTEESHTGATHENEGKCTLCDTQYETHGQSENTNGYVATETGHKPIYTCTQSGCSATYDGTEESHTGATHANEGKCTICEYQYENHGQSEEIKEYIPTENGHTPIYGCTEEGCTENYEGDEEAHTGGTHENGGECTACGEPYEVHGQSEDVKEYISTETGHTPIYECTCEGCSITYEGDEEAHTGATHANDGKCTICGEQYEMHGQSEEIKEYIPTENGHTPIYGCTEEGCTENYEGEEENHTGGTHENGGKCDICDEQYQNHGQSEEVKEYIPTENGHKPIYGCTEEGCTENYEGEEEAHTGGTHENGGKCDICDEQYQNHGQSEEVKEYIPTENGHKPIYGCTEEGCTENYEGEEEAHTGGTHENGGKCDICDEQYQNHGQSEEVKEYIPTEDGHKPIYGCTEEGCTEIYEGEEEPHDYENGGCTICGKEDTRKLTITSEKYKIEEKYISKVQPETKANQFKANIETNATEINIFNKENELIKDDEKVETGMKVQFKLEDITREFIIIVSGDVDGNGNADMIDMLNMNRYRLGKKELEEMYLRAGDVTEDGNVDFKDLIKINQFRLNKITEL